MPNVTTVTITNGVPTAGSGTVSTLDNLVGTAGSGSSNVLTVQGAGSGTALPASQSGTWTVQPGNTANTTPWLASINDGTNTAKVQAASTAAAAADKSLVVNESPNSQLSVATGTTADAAWVSGSGTVIALLKAVVGNVTASIPAGTNNIGFVTITPSTTGGWSKWSTAKNNSNTALTNTVVQVKGSAANFGGYFIYNSNASATTVQVFDAATAGAVTLGTTRPDLILEIPATSGANVEFANGVNFASGIQIAATTTASGSTAPSSGLDVTILYK